MYTFSFTVIASAFFMKLVPQSSRFFFFSLTISTYEADWAFKKVVLAFSYEQLCNSTVGIVEALFPEVV